MDDDLAALGMNQFASQSRDEPVRGRSRRRRQGSVPIKAPQAMLTNEIVMHEVCAA
jgi:hypothetical protein